MTGFIAQEVEQAAQTSGYDFSGVTRANDDLGMYSLSYSQFVVPLVKAVQEQQQQIEALENNNNTLQRENELLQSKLEMFEQRLKQLENLK
ncbi:MAG: hypothetical protein DRI89_15515 [Bacteroidetes bacterium]|nr:MAG: hypothetical protein DRI89_15515 [Bacteroidota bacterium]